MRVMQVIYSFNVGGSEAVARDIALNMTDNVTHAVVSLEKDGPLRKILEDNQIQTFFINKQPSERISPMIRLWKAIRQFKPDVVHTHHLYELFYAWPGAILSGARIIHTEHEYYSLMSPKTRFLLKQISNFCRSVTGVNEETSAFLREQIGIPARKVHTVVNGINLERYKSGRHSRVDVGLSHEDLVAGIVARLHPVKDHSTLFNAFRLVVDKQPNAKLLIIGDGRERKNLEKLAGDLKLNANVFFLGTRSDVPDLLQCMDVFVLSSKEEGLPLCVLEAMAAAKPVVATKVGGIPSVVKSGETGQLIPPADPQAMSMALLEIFDNSAHGKEMGKNGRKRIEKNYDLKKTISEYYSIYKH
jgi:L-malate glycosyltransferase